MSEASSLIEEIQSLLDARADCKGRHVFSDKDYQLVLGDDYASVPCMKCGQERSVKRIKSCSPKFDTLNRTVTIQEPYPGVADCLHEYIPIDGKGKCHRCGDVKPASAIATEDWQTP